MDINVTVVYKKTKQNIEVTVAETQVSALVVASSCLFSDHASEVINRI